MKCFWYHIGLFRIFTNKKLQHQLPTHSQNRPLW